MKVNSLNRNNLPNATHIQYYEEFCVAAERYGIDKSDMAALYALLVVVLKDEDVALKKINKSAYTAEIADEDSYRDELWRGMVDTNKAAMLHYDDEVRQAAKTNKIVFDTYGNLAPLSLDDESSSITNVLQDMRGKYADSVVKVGLTGWADALETSNNNVKRLMRERYSESADKTDIVLREARQKVDAAYNAVVERINAAIIIEGEEKYRDFVTAINVVIKRYADIMAQRKGRAAAKKEKNETL
jgi:hypothetical protein